MLLSATDLSIAQYTCTCQALNRPNSKLVCYPPLRIVVVLLYTYNMANTRVNKFGKQMTQAWLTVEAKKAALTAAYHADQSVEVWISAAIIKQAEAEK